MCQVQDISIAVLQFHGNLGGDRCLTGGESPPDRINMSNEMC